MAIKKVSKEVLVCLCERCEYEWTPRITETDPIRCPRCKSHYWNKKRRNDK